MLFTPATAGRARLTLNIMHTYIYTVLPIHCLCAYYTTVGNKSHAAVVLQLKFMIPRKGKSACMHAFHCHAGGRGGCICVSAHAGCQLLNLKSASLNGRRKIGLSNNLGRLACSSSKRYRPTKYLHLNFGLSALQKYYKSKKFDTVWQWRLKGLIVTANHHAVIFLYGTSVTLKFKRIAKQLI